MRVIKVIDSEPTSSIKKILVGTSSLVVTMFPRYDLQKFTATALASQQAVYLLYNETVSGQYSIYVGETEEIQKRLEQHNKSLIKSFWSRTIVIQDSCMFLNKAHFKYLEFMLYSYLKLANRGVVVNSTVPVKPRLSEDDEILANEFLSSIQSVLKVFNIKFLDPPVVGNFEEEPDVYFFDLDGCSASLRVNGKSDFVLEKGSVCIAKGETKDDSFKNILKIRTNLIKEKKLIPIEGTQFMELLEDVRFDSEHEAFTFCTLQCLDSSFYWKNDKGQPLLF